MLSGYNILNLQDDALDLLKWNRENYLSLLMFIPPQSKKCEFKYGSRCTVSASIRTEAN